MLRLHPSTVDYAILAIYFVVVLGIGFVQKQTDAGERSRFRAVVAVGNSDGFDLFGGISVAWLAEVRRIAIEGSGLW